MVPGMVFTDVDGTLLDHDHRCVGASATSIAELGRRGIAFVLVSARMPEALYPIQHELGFAGPLVCYSGAYVLDERGGELLSRTIPLDRALEVRDVVSASVPGACCCAYGFHTWACDDSTDFRIVRESRIVGVTPRQATLEDAFDERGIHKFLLIGRPGQGETVREAVARACPDLTVVRSSPILCEVMAAGVSKAAGVRLLAERQGVDLSDAVAFGDGMNDVGMLDVVPQSYAMANADERVRSRAPHVTRLDNDHNGVGDTLEALLGGDFGKD